MPCLERLHPGYHPDTLLVSPFWNRFIEKPSGMTVPAVVEDRLICIRAYFFSRPLRYGRGLRAVPSLVVKW